MKRLLKLKIFWIYAICHLQYRIEYELKWISVWEWCTQLVSNVGLWWSEITANSFLKGLSSSVSPTSKLRTEILPLISSLMCIFAWINLRARKKVNFVWTKKKKQLKEFFQPELDDVKPLNINEISNWMLNENVIAINKESPKILFAVCIKNCLQKTTLIWNKAKKRGENCNAK